MMNLPEKTRRFLPLMLLLWVCSVVPAKAQNWQEHYVLNQGNYLSFQRSVLFNGNIVRHPDPTIGSLSLSQQGSIWTVTFNPVNGAEGIAEFIIEYFPNQLPPSPKIEAFRIHVSSSYIIAEKDFFSIAENSTDNVLTVLDNDVPNGSDSLGLSHIAAVTNGTASIAADGQSVLFTPIADFSGIAYLTYVVCDALGACAHAEASISVIPEQPVPNDTIYLSTHSRAPVVAYMPGTGFAVSTQPVHGSLSELGPDSWQYLPDPEFSGADAFTMASDTLLRHVVVEVYYKDAPNTFVNHDVIFTRVDETVTFNVLTNDVKAYPIDAWTHPQKGTLTYDGQGYFTYTPDSAYTGAQEFAYTTCFLSQCETGRVIIYVGDMIPENAETYDLLTQKDVPLVLNYQIPIDGYTFIVHASPVHGELTLYNDYQAVDVMCSTVEGYDLMVYTPPAGYTGSDYFEIVYCLDGGACHLVKVDVTIADGEDMPCPCVNHCVWPGDADGSGRVDMHDLLALGWQTGAAGPGRNYPDNTTWMGQFGEDWESEMWGMNSKYADSDGNGVISVHDVDAISDHYLKRHKLVPQITGLKADYEFDIIPLVYELDSGDLAMFAISIGSETHPVLDMHGMTFSLNLPEDVYDSTTLSVQFLHDSWLGHDAPSIQLVKQPHNGRLDAAYSRTSGKPASGVGIIGVMTFIITDNIDGFKTPDGRVPLRIGINSVSSMASSGLTYDVTGNAATVYLKAAEQTDSSPEDHVFVYPNPSSGDLLNVHANGDRSLKQIELYDLSGALLQTWTDLTEKLFSPDVSKLQTGLYVLRITTTDGVVSRKVEIVK